MNEQKTRTFIFLLSVLIFILKTSVVSALAVGKPALDSLEDKLLSSKATQLIEASNEISAAGTCAPIGWSNRLGSVLTPVSIPGVYSADRPFYWNRIDVGGRMCVIACENPTGPPQLFIHSPVSLDEQLIDAIDSLGEVKWVVSPNYEHLKYAKEWKYHYRNAKMIACPGLMDREPGVYDVEIPYGIKPGDVNEDLWDLEEIQAKHVDCEINPFTGRPFFNEVVFFHKPSKSLLVTDIYWNYPESIETNKIYSELPGGESSTINGNDVDRDFGVWELAPLVEKIPFGTKAWKFGMDKIYRPFYMNLMINDKSKFEAVVKQMTDVWDVNTIIPAHGDIVRGSRLSKTILKQHFGS